MIYGVNRNLLFVAGTMKKNSTIARTCSDFRRPCVSCL